jgi:ribosomal protein S18 acetylase RimI-like enzyme
MENIAVRLAGKKDLPALALLFDAYRRFYDMPGDLERARAYLRARLEKSESVIFVAADAAGELIGFCQLYPTFCSVFMASIYVLNDLFVSPEARGTGTGRALLAAAESHAGQAGAVRIELRTAKTNGTAQALYASSGWKRDELFYRYSKKLQPA